jgi:hypothetical protein
MAIFTSPQALAFTMRLRAATIDRGLVGTTRLVAEQALRISKARMKAGVYDHPIPTTKSGKPKWIRTGLLYALERVEYAADGKSAKITNTVRYAEIRHEMGKPGRKRTQFPAHWRDEMREQMRDIVGRTHHDMIQKVFAGLPIDF